MPGEGFVKRRNKCRVSNKRRSRIDAGYQPGSRNIPVYKPLIVYSLWNRRPCRSTV